MSNPKISVLMPAYNAEPYIGEAIQSILDQTFRDFEFIIIDDRSKDNTRQIIQNYAKIDGRIIAVRNDENLKICKTRNKLLSLAKGKYIARLDADDIAIIDRLQKQFNFLEENLDVGILGGIIQFFDNNNQYKTWFRSYKGFDDELRKNIFQQSPLSQGTAMARKVAIDQIGGFDETLKQAEDLDLSFRIGEKWKFANLCDVMIKCRYHINSISSSNLSGNIEDTLNVRNRYINSDKYNFGIKDRFAYILTRIMKFIPNFIVIKLFELLRG